MSTQNSHHWIVGRKSVQSPCSLSLSLSPSVKTVLWAAAGNWGKQLLNSTCIKWRDVRNCPKVKVWSLRTSNPLILALLARPRLVDTLLSPQYWYLGPRWRYKNGTKIVQMAQVAGRFSQLPKACWSFGGRRWRHPSWTWCQKGSCRNNYGTMIWYTLIYYDSAWAVANTFMHACAIGQVLVTWSSNYREKAW